MVNPVDLITNPCNEVALGNPKPALHWPHPSCARYHGYNEIADQIEARMKPKITTLSAHQEILAFKKKLLSERLEKITQPQKEKFNRIFPKGVPEEKLELAIDICDRTIRKNEEENNEP